MTTDHPHGSKLYIETSFKDAGYDVVVTSPGDGWVRLYCDEESEKYVRQNVDRYLSLGIFGSVIVVSTKKLKEMKNEGN